MYIHIISRVKQVPSLLLSTSALPPGLLVRGVGCLIQARVCKPKKRWKGEDSASNVSSVSPKMVCLHKFGLASFRLLSHLTYSPT